MNRILLVLTVIIAQSIPTTAESREKDLDRWMDRDLIPHVRQQLLVHPRFKGETVMFVVLKDNTPTPVSNALAISLRDRLLDAAVNTTGVSISWQQGRSPATLMEESVDCTRNDVHYYIGLELTQELDSSYAVRVRALDLEDRSWVTGFGKNWQGQLGTIHRQALRQSRIDTTFRGSRDVPYSIAETDLLASHLAHELSCALMKQTGGEYVIEPASPNASGEALDDTVELAGNNLARHGAINLAAEDRAGNSILQGKAHRIDASLFQYWLTVTPTGDADGLSTLSASAYVLMPSQALVDRRPEMETRPAIATRSLEPAATTLAGTSISIPNAGKTALLGPLQIAEPSRLEQCSVHGTVLRSDYRRSQSRCSLLQAEPRTDAIVFFLAHTVNLGLVRLGDTECRERTLARIAGTDELMHLPIPRTLSGRGATETYDWLVEPELDTYYAVALTDARAARAIANHIDHLPMRCSDVARQGLEGPALRQWLEEFAMLAAKSSQHLDWRALQIKDVY